MEAPVSQWLIRQPAPPLVPYVERYAGYRLAGFPAGLHRGLPSRHMTFIAGIGAPIDVVAQTDPRQAPHTYRCVVGGLQASPALIAHDGSTEGIAVELTPLGARVLFAMPASALWNTSVELEDVIGPLGRELWERLQPLSSWDERFAVCDDVLLRLLDREQPPAAPLRSAWNAIVRSAGTIPVSELASSVGYTRQHLTRLFALEFGLTPKLACRIVRFDRARRLLQSAPPFVSIAQIAAVCGYYDQAHLTRDFVELAGCPPARLLAEEDLVSFRNGDDGARGS